MAVSLIGFIRARWATTLLATTLVLMLAYRGLVYRYPSQKPERNAFDYACDVVGFSYHYLMMAFDSRFNSLTNDYHIRQALRYKPDSAFMRQYLPPGPSEK